MSGRSLTSFSTSWQMGSIVLGLTFLFPFSAWGQERYLHRTLFFEQTIFGSLAWVDTESPSYASAKGYEMVHDLSSPGCHSLDPRSRYWFLINHNNATRNAEVGFFAVRIVGRALKGAPTEALLTYRSPGWFDDGGKPLPEGPPDVDRHRPTIKDFLLLHDDAASTSPPSQRLAELTSGVGVWHAHIEAGEPSSWENRHIFASASHLDDAQQNGNPILDARLIRFTARDIGNTLKPTLFYFNKGVYDTLWISISAPNFDLDDSKTEIRMGVPCQ
jgi:hypothetical protein